MNHLKLLASTAVALVLSLDVRAQGHIVPKGIVTNLFAGEIDLVWPAATQVNGFGFTPVGKTGGLYPNVFSFWEPATIGARVFLISLNQPFTLSQVRDGTYSEVSDSTNPVLPANPSFTFDVNAPFYVALYSGAELAGYYPPGNTTPVEYTDPVFGWARLVNNNGVIQMLDSALEYGGGGIFAGTENIIPVPEPSTLTLVGLGVLLFGLCKRRQFGRI
jgi:PEP-CTERM motif